jgi:hypothetical protein
MRYGINAGTSLIIRRGKYHQPNVNARKSTPGDDQSAMMT